VGYLTTTIIQIYERYECTNSMHIEQFQVIPQIFDIFKSFRARKFKTKILPKKQRNMAK